MKDLETQKKKVLQEIANTDKLLKDTKDNTESLLNRIQLISAQIEMRKKVLLLMEKEVQSMVEEQKKIEREIKELEVELSVKRDAYLRAVEGIMRNRQNENKLLFVLSGRSLSESYRRFIYLKDYSEWRKRQAEEILRKGDELNGKKDSLRIALIDKEAILKKREIESQKLRDEEANFQKEVKVAQSKETELKKILEQKKRQSQALDNQISKLIADEIKRQEEKARQERLLAERKAREEKAAREAQAAREREANKKKNEQPTRGKETPELAVAESKEVTPKVEAVAPTAKENLALSTNFASNKGKLPYPISGKYIITGRFGTNRQSQWVTTSSGGIDIKSQAGAKAKAVFNGEVTSIVAIPGYGTCVLLRHGNYYTFYGNISDILVKKGDKVSTGQELGVVYTDPSTNVSEMHFQIWEQKTKLNPELWLR